MTFKSIAERNLIARSLVTGEEKSFTIKIGEPELIPGTGLAFCCLDYDWLGAELYPPLLAGISRVTGTSEIDALQEALDMQSHLSLFIKDYVFSHCRKKSFSDPKKPLPQFLNISEVMGLTGNAKSTIYSWVKKGYFPKPIATGPNSSRFRSEDLRAWCNDPVRWREDFLLSTTYKGDECL